MLSAARGMGGRTGIRSRSSRSAAAFELHSQLGVLIRGHTQRAAMGLRPTHSHHRATTLILAVGAVLVSRCIWRNNSDYTLAFLS